MRIVQISDIHTGSSLFSPDLLEAAVAEANALAPDLVAVAGDLNTEGHRWEFDDAKSYLDRLECPNVVVVMGNHDARNVGYRHFEDLFGARARSLRVPVAEGEAKVVALGSTNPDLSEGEVGRENYAWLDSEFRGWVWGPRILVVHHHILAAPGTATSLRTRGIVAPYYNVIEFGPETVTVNLRYPGEGEEALARLSRQPVTTSGVLPELERFARYDMEPVRD